MNEQSSPAVYGLFVEDTDQDVLLGLYFTEEAAEAARKEYEHATFVQRVTVRENTSHRFVRPRH